MGEAAATEPAEHGLEALMAANLDAIRKVRAALMDTIHEQGVWTELIAALEYQKENSDAIRLACGVLAAGKAEAKASPRRRVPSPRGGQGPLMALVPSA